MGLFDFLRKDAPLSEQIAARGRVEIASLPAQGRRHVPVQGQHIVRGPAAPNVYTGSTLSHPAPRTVPITYRGTGDVFKGAGGITGGGMGSVNKGAVFPERVGIDLLPVWDALVRGPQRTLGLLKLIPGNPVGEVFRGIGESPFGEFVGQIGEAVVSPLRSIDLLLNTPIPERVKGGGDVFAALLSGKDAGSVLAANIENTRDHIGAVLDIATSLTLVGGLAKVGGKTILGSAVKGLFNPFVGAKGSNALKWFVAPAAKEYFQAAGKKEMAEAYGRVVGRFATTTSLVGGTIGGVIKHVAPDSWAAKEISDNRLVPEDDPWSVPLDIALTAPLDLFGATGRVSKYLTRDVRIIDRLFGEVNALDGILPGWKDAVKNGVVTQQAVQWVYSKGLRDAAMWSLMDDVNKWVIQANKGKPVEEAIALFDHPNLLNFASQDAYDQAVRMRMRDMMALPTRQRNTLIREAIEGRGAPGNINYHRGWDWAGLSTANRLINLEEFHRVAKHIDGPLAGDAANQILVVDKYGIRDIGKQAIEYLRSPSFDNSKDAWAAFKNRFPSVPEAYATGRGADVADRLEATFTMLNDLPESALIGRLRARVDELSRSIIAAGDKATAAEKAELSRLRGELGEVGRRAAKKWTDEAELLTRQADSREDELFRLEGEDATIRNLPGRMLLESEIERARVLASQARIAAFNAEHVLGSRYLLGHPPVGPIQKVFGDNVPMPRAATGLRKAAGDLYDKLFGAIPNIELGRETYKRVTDSLMEKGFSREAVGAIYQDLGKWIDDSGLTHTFKTGFKLTPFASVYHLPSGVINKIVQRHAAHLTPEAAKAFNGHEVFYRAYPGPLKVFQQQVFGRAIDIPYNKHLVNFTRTAFPMFRFYLSPRFIAMNFFEGSFYARFFASGKRLRGISDEQVEALMKQELGTAGGRDVGMIEQFELGLENAKKIFHSKRLEEQSAALLDTLYRSPHMKDYIKTAGIKNEEQFVQHVADWMTKRDDMAKGLIADTKAEVVVAKEIESLKDRLSYGMTEQAEVEVRLRLETKLAELNDMVLTRMHKAEEAAQQIPKEMRPFMEVMTQKDRELAHWTRQVMYGNPSRNATERVLNSFLLFWPISYQVKATKNLFEFMTSHGFGYKWNLTPAAAMAQAGEWHKDKLENEAEYKRFFDKNRQALFLAQQLFPALPDETGTSLAPIFRLPLQVARGYRTPAQGVSKLGDIGPIYDYNLGVEFVREQTRPGGILYDLVKEPE